MRQLILAACGVGFALLASTPTGATPMEVRVTGTIVNGYDFGVPDLVAPTFGTSSASLYGLQMELRLFYDTDFMPPDTDTGPGVAYGFDEPVVPPPQWVTGQVTINGFTLALDTSRFGRISAYQSGVDSGGAIGAFYMTAGDWRDEPYNSSDNEFLEFSAFAYNTVSDAAPFDPAGTYDFSTPLYPIQFSLTATGDLWPGSPTSPRWSDGQNHRIQISSLDSAAVWIAPVAVPVPAAAWLLIGAFGALGVLRRKTLS